MIRTWPLRMAILGSWTLSAAMVMVLVTGGFVLVGEDPTVGPDAGTAVSTTVSRMWLRSRNDLRTKEA